MMTASCNCSTSDSYVVLAFEPTMTPTRVIPTTLLFENSDSRILTNHYLDKQHNI